jgi:hypothetical protein
MAVLQRLYTDPLSLPVDNEVRRGVAGFPRRPVAFLWHYVRRRPLLHFSALAAVLGAAVSACAAQYGLKLIVDAMAQADGPTRALWVALAIPMRLKLFDPEIPFNYHLNFRTYVSRHEYRFSL